MATLPRVVLVDDHGLFRAGVRADLSVTSTGAGLPEAALALLIQGTTAWHLYRTSARLAEGESVVVQSAAGGTGSPPATGSASAAASQRRPSS